MDMSTLHAAFTNVTSLEPLAPDASPSKVQSYRVAAEECLQQMVLWSFTE